MMRPASLLAAIALLAACSGPHPPSGEYEGLPSGPYTLTLRLDPQRPVPDETTQLSFALIHSDSGKPVHDLQVLHERVIHNFIVSRDFRHFAHIHQEDFRPVSKLDLEQARLSFPFTFPQTGAWRIVSEFTHRDRSWIKHFDLQIDDRPEPPQPIVNLARVKNFGDYQARLSTSPERPVAGHPVELVLELSRNGEPVTNLGMHLGAELHAASWRLDGEYFGHMHSYTPHMAAMMAAARQDAGTAARQARARMMLQMAAGSREQVYFGPRLPMRHSFDAPGTYALFIQCAPGGQPRVFDFMLEVQAAGANAKTAIDSMVTPEARH